jgi:hypothetical protein
MPRARKDNLAARKRWEIYVTALERLRIEEGARAMGLPIGAAVTKALSDVRHVERADWREIVRLLIDLDRRMGEILHALLDRSNPLDALEVAAALVSLDRGVRAHAMPWTLREEKVDEPPDEGSDDLLEEQDDIGRRREAAPC